MTSLFLAALLLSPAAWSTPSDGAFPPPTEITWNDLEAGYKAVIEFIAKKVGEKRGQHREAWLSDYVEWLKDLLRRHPADGADPVRHAAELEPQIKETWRIYRSLAAVPNPGEDRMGELLNGGLSLMLDDLARSARGATAAERSADYDLLVRAGTALLFDHALRAAGPDRMAPAIREARAALAPCVSDRTACVDPDSGKRP